MLCIGPLRFLVVVLIIKIKPCGCCDCELSNTSINAVLFASPYSSNTPQSTSSPSKLSASLAKGLTVDSSSKCSMSYLFTLVILRTLSLEFLNALSCDFNIRNTIPACSLVFAPATICLEAFGYCPKINSYNEIPATRIDLPFLRAKLIYTFLNLRILLLFLRQP